MRVLASIAAALALASCGQSSPRGEACALEAASSVTWSSSTAPDAILARADGPNCTQAAATLTIRNASGDPLWVFASTYYDLTAGGVPPEGAPAADRAAVQNFLASWADVTELRAGDLPAWSESMSRPGEGVAPFNYESPFDRETYEALRARNLATLCYAAAVAAVQCLVIDPASHAPAMIVAYGS